MVRKFNEGKLDEETIKKLESHGIVFGAKPKYKTFEQWIDILDQYLKNNKIEDLTTSTIFNGENLGSIIFKKMEEAREKNYLKIK